MWILRLAINILTLSAERLKDLWQQSGSRAQRYAPLFITIRPKENIKISKLLI